MVLRTYLVSTNKFDWWNEFKGTVKDSFNIIYIMLRIHLT